MFDPIPIATDAAAFWETDWRPPALETERLRLRAFEDRDAAGVFAYAGNPNVTQYTLWETHRTIADSANFVGPYARSRYADQNPEPVAVTLKETREIIGAVGCFWATKPHRCMELGYWLAEPYWGRGFAAEAARALVSYVFRDFEVERVQAHCVVGNDASARVLEKLGLKFEGIARSAVFRRERFWDVRRYAVLRGEWPG